MTPTTESKSRRHSGRKRQTPRKLTYEAKGNPTERHEENDCEGEAGLRSEGEGEADKTSEEGEGQQMPETSPKRRRAQTSVKGQTSAPLISPPTLMTQTPQTPQTATTPEPVATNHRSMTPATDTSSGRASVRNRRPPSTLTYETKGNPTEHHEGSATHIPSALNTPATTAAETAATNDHSDREEEEEELFQQDNHEDDEGGSPHDGEGPHADRDAESVNSDPPDVALDSDTEEKVLLALERLRQKSQKYSDILVEGTLNYSDVTVDIDAVQMYADTVGAPDLVKALPDGAMWNLWNLVDRRKVADTSRLAMKFDGNDVSVPRASARSSKKAKRVALHRLPNVKLADCFVGNKQFHLNMYWTNPPRISSVSFFEQAAIKVIVKALNMAIVAYRKEYDDVEDVPAEDVSMSREASKAVKFRMKDEGRKTNQLLHSNRFSNRAMAKLLTFFLLSLKELTRGDGISAREEMYAREFCSSTLFGLAVAGTKHAMVVAKFTRESVTEARDALPDDDPSKHWSDNRYLRKLLHEAINQKAPALLRKEFPPLRLAGEDYIMPKIMVDIAYTFHPKRAGKSLLLSRSSKGREKYAEFIRKSQACNGTPMDSLEAVASDPEMDGEDFSDTDSSAEEADDMSDSSSVMLSDTVDAEMHEATPGDLDEVLSQTRDPEEEVHLEAGRGEANEDGQQEEERHPRDAMDAEMHAATPGDLDEEQSQTRDPEEEVHLEPGRGEANEDGQQEEAHCSSDMMDKIMDPVSTSAFDEVLSPPSDPEDEAHFETVDDQMDEQLTTPDGLSAAPDNQGLNDDKLNFIETTAPFEETKFRDFRLLFLMMLSNFHSGKFSVNRTEERSADDVSHKTQHVPQLEAIGGQVYADALKNMMNRQDTNAWRDLIGFSTAIASCLRNEGAIPEAREKVRGVIEKISGLIEDVMSNFDSSQGAGVRVETWVRVDGIFEDDDACLCLNNPPLMPVFQVRTKDLTRYFKAVTTMYWEPVKNLFPADLMGERSASRLGISMLSPGAKTTIVLFSEFIELQFGAFPFEYKGTVMKSMWKLLMREQSPYLKVPESLRHEASDFEKSILKLPYTIKTHLMLLPTYSEAVALLSDTADADAPSRSRRRQRAMGLAAGEAMARSKAAFLRGSTELSVTYETYVVALRKILYTFSVIGKLRSN